MTNIIIFPKGLETARYQLVNSHIKTMCSGNEYGFMRKMSTTTNLFSITQFSDHSQSLHGLYISKAFDELDHETLVLKVERLSFDQDICKFFGNYVYNRYQHVHYNVWVQTLIRVPTFFNLYVKDISNYSVVPNLLCTEDFHFISHCWNCRLVFFELCSAKRIM